MQRSLQSCYRALGLTAQQATNRIRLCSGGIFCFEAVVVVVFMVEVQRSDGYKQLEWLLVCLRPSECIEGLFSVQVHHSNAQIDELHEALEVVVLLEKHSGIKFFRLTVLAKRAP